VELARSAANFFGADGLLLPEKFARFEQFLAKVNDADHEVRCREDVLEFIAEVRDAERREQLLKHEFPRGKNSAAFKKLLKAPLYDYQAEGALFAARAGRCLIGDTMGLGKTIQAIAAAEIMARHLGVERVLVVCPTSLKHQWQREIERFTDRSVQVVGGLRPMRSAWFKQDSFFKITNYDTVYADLDLIEAWGPDLVVLDEAQRIKNWNTRVARSIKKVDSPYAIVLTGTPLENRLEELVSIVQFVDRYRLGPTFRLLHDHQQTNEDGRVVGYKDLDRIGATLKPILIRRQKDQVADQLPGRLDKNFFVPMTQEQWKHHTENKETVARLVMKWRRYKHLTEADQRRLMIALQNMRMACDSSYLLDPSSDHGVKADEVLTVLDEMYETPGTKVVLFSQWLRMHELVVRRLQKRGWEHVLFHGGVPGNKRKDLVDRFRQDPKCRAFLATDAGGVGLNLQHASAVVNLDLPWNPAVLEQRIGRVHRLGQRQPVQVVNFVSKGTIEEGMLSVLQFKKSLFAGVLDGGEKEVFLGGSRLNKFIETVEKTTAAIPPAMLEESNGESRERPAADRTIVDDEDRAAPTPATLADPWGGLLQAGMSILQQLQAAAQPDAARRPGGQSAPLQSIVQRDARTGEPYLRLPVPSADVLNQAMQAFGALLQSFQK
jgi:SNF2 family DNA or RNA helicase